jgi:hypothetical protein
MDRREKFKTSGANDEFTSKQLGYNRDDGSVTDSWFKKRLNHVRTEARKELRSKVIRLAREE